MNKIKTKKTSIIFYEPHTAYGSIEEQLSLIIDGLIKKGDYKISLFCPLHKDVDMLASASKKADVIRFPTFKNGLLEISYLYKHFKRIHPDIIHINDTAFNAMIAANLAGIKRRIITYHSPMLDIKLNLKGCISRMLAFRENWDVIAITNLNKNFMVCKRGIKEKKIKVINYGLDKNKFMATVDRLNIRKSFGIPEGAFVIINVARLCEHKAQHILVHSIGLLPQDLFERTFVLIVGDGEKRKALENLISRLDLSKKVFLTGHRDDIPNLLHSSDIFVLTSVLEATCVSLIESMAMGVPIIASNVGGIRDIVEDGITGLLIPPGDPEKLSQGIVFLSKDRNKMRAMSVAGKERFSKYFQKERMIREIHKFYEEGTDF